MVSTTMSFFMSFAYFFEQIFLRMLSLEVSQLPKAPTMMVPNETFLNRFFSSLTSASYFLCYSARFCWKIPGPFSKGMVTSKTRASSSPL